MSQELYEHIVLVFLPSRQVSLKITATEDAGNNTQRARNAGQPPQRKTDVVYSPFLDMIPSEPDTMKTAMVEAQRLTQLTGQEWTIFTSDQQLYKELVHITWVDKEKFQKFIPRLGDRHMLMSFVAAVGYLIGGSGIEEIISSAFVGVPKLLTGKIPTKCPSIETSC